MANPFITTAAPTTVVDPEAQALQRQKQYAAMLMQQNQQPQGQMIGNHFVAPSWTQQLNAALNPIIGGYMMNKADENQLALADKLRKQSAQEMMQYNELMYGKQGTPDVVPQGQTLRDDEGNLTYGSQVGVAPVQANPSAAFQYAMQARSPMVNAMATEMMKPQKFSEGEILQRFNPTTGQMETVGKGADKYHAPISVDTGTSTILLDPKTMQPIAKYGKSVAGHVLETENGPVIVDTRTKQATPIMMNGQPITGGKPLTEGQSQATAFGIRMKESNDILKGLEDKGVRTTGAIKSTVSGGLGAVPLIGGALGEAGANLTNWTASSDQQATDQARRNFITAVLRKESGASISPTEFANEEKKYFPQVGDSKETVAQKQKARETAIKAMEIQAGPGAKQIQSFGKPVEPPKLDASSAAKSWLQANPNHPLAGQVRAKLEAEGKL